MKKSKGIKDIDYKLFLARCAAACESILEEGNCRSIKAGKGYCGNRMLCKESLEIAFKTREELCPI